MKIARALLLPVLLLALSSETMQGATCTWVTPPNTIDFGVYSVFSTNSLYSNTALSIRCSPPGQVTLTLSTGVLSTYTPRVMYLWIQNVTLPYNLYLDAATSLIWGDGSSGTQRIAWTPPANNSVLSPTIFGRIPPDADVPPGPYVNTINATLNAGSGGVSQRNFFVTVDVAPECTVSTTPMNFGTYDPVGAHASTPLDATSLINVSCTRTTAASVTLDLGSHASGATRRMRGSPGDYLVYQIFRDAGRSSVWNTTNTNGGTSTSKNIPIGGGFVAYGRIAGGQDVAIGNYSDNVVVTVNY